MILAVHLPGWRDVNLFLIDFWPNVVATMIGVAIAGWLTVMLYHWTTARETAAEVAAARARARELLRVLRPSIDTNAQAARQRITSLQTSPNRPLTFDSGLDVEVWEALRPQLTENLDAPGLLADLAAHFRDVRRLDEITRLRVRTSLVPSDWANKLGDAADQHSIEIAQLVAGVGTLTKKMDTYLSP